MNGKATPSIPCPCRSGWVFRAVQLAIGASIHEAHCPRCRIPRLVVMRGAQVLGVIRLLGRDPQGIRDSLRSQPIGLTHHEQDDLVSLARQLGDAQDEAVVQRSIA